ncbi:MAG: trimethylamine methyltransferase family protein [Candidatus Bathyarchaeota archaeon]|jgi:trimethylamine--corrinoid protein Co-methyltransferase|nr:trimethylamine methyltransferase family protein [Candidatus Bathyarchaeota archaeon]
MSKSSFPKFQPLSEDEIESIHLASLRLLEEVGVKIYSDTALKLLSDGGAEVDFSKKLAFIPQHLVKEALTKAPSTIKLYGRNRKHDRTLEGDRVTFNPGSSALYILDYEENEIRKPVSKDLADLVRLTDALEHVHAQSTAMVVSDVPQAIVDRYRLYIVLKNSFKPIITGAFSIDGLYDMKRMLEVVVGGEKELAKKPMAIFDVCPSSPLKWSELDAQNLIDCAKFRLPAEIIPAIQLSATGPATIAGSLVQHNAEFLSGLLMTQLINPGAPVIYGGSPTVLDQRYATACLGAVEAMLFGCSYTQIAKSYGLPTHMYIGLSDAKVIDAQCGFESGIGIVLGTLAGINVISGPGMLNFENCQSLEKLVIDNEICGMALRLAKGVKVEDETIAFDLIRKVGPGGVYLAERHTLEWIRKEQFIPSEIIDRKEWKVWKDAGKKDIMKRAHEIVEKKLKEHEPEPLPQDVQKDLDSLMEDIMKKH